MNQLPLTVAFAVHLLCVNVAAVAPLYALWLEVRAKRRGDLVAAALSRRVGLFGVGSLLVGIALGLAAWALLGSGGHGRFSVVLARMPVERWYWISGELAFYALGMLAYGLMWQRMSCCRIVHRLLAVFCATNLLYHFPPLFVVVSEVSTRPELRDEIITPALIRSQLLDGETLSRTVHHWLAAVSAGGLLVAWFAVRAKDSTAHTVGEAQKRIAAAAGRAALVATLMQLPVGVWVLVQLRPLARDSLLGEDIWGTLLFAGSLFTALGMLHQLATIAMGHTTKPRVNRAAITLLAITVLMSATLHRSRVADYKRLPAEPAEAAAR